MTCRVQFTERMVGAFAFGESDYRAGYRAPSDQLEFQLTISTDDVDTFISDPEHVAAAEGFVCAESFGGQRPVVEGEFNLFVDEGPRIRHMLYRLYFVDLTGRPLTLAGFKDVQPGPVTKIWPETSTLYTRILTGHVPVTDGGSSCLDGLVGSGILHIRPLDFARQLTTFRARGPSRGGEARALAQFGRLFAGELWQVFHPFAGRADHG